MFIDERNIQGTRFGSKLGTQRDRRCERRINLSNGQQLGMRKEGIPKPRLITSSGFAEGKALSTLRLRAITFKEKYVSVQLSLPLTLKSYYVFAQADDVSTCHAIPGASERRLEGERWPSSAV